MKLVYSLTVVLLLSLPAARVTAQDDNETCLGCHDDPDITGLNAKGEEVSMFVAEQSLDSSVHADLVCVDCHTALAGNEEYPHAESLPPADCSGCHDDIAATFEESAHGQAKDNPFAPRCSSCHGTHNILPKDNPQSKVAPKNLPYTCSSCHHKIELKRDPDIRIADSFDRYMRGVHAQGLAKGIGSAASCDDCHGMHDLKKASDPESKVSKMRIPKTCAKCHNDIYIQYQRGIHGKALAAGILDSPNCTDCHGEHEILDINDPKSPVNRSNLAEYVCGRCHNNPRIVEKYGLPKGRFTSYQDSYHGLALHGGSVKAASCVSCHKAHEILPASNPASSINPANRVQTCRQCHPKANARFAMSYTHDVAEAEFHGLTSTLQTIYIIAIVIIIGSMLTHNLIILFRYIVDKHRKNKRKQTVERFTPGMVYQHLILTIAFLTLVVTGFGLRYPQAWWVRALHAIGIHEAARGVLHRIAALMLVYISIHHAFFLAFTKRGRRELRDLLPTKQDFQDVIDNIKYHLRLTPNKPRFGRYDYTEKAEYWALVWGTIIMALTGAVLWFPAKFTGIFPAWIVQVAEVIHLYEAWLATLAIAVFHFFFVIFHPEQYPMSLTWLTGRMTVEECKHHHPAWYE
ncbi:MAG: hypothetical protein D6800_08380, partial [Candidatus Zixiibacteriota bacterium]